MCVCVCVCVRACVRACVMTLHLEEDVDAKERRASNERKHGRVSI